MEYQVMAETFWFPAAVEANSAPAVKPAQRRKFPKSIRSGNGIKKASPRKPKSRSLSAKLASAANLLFVPLLEEPPSTTPGRSTASTSPSLRPGAPTPTARRSKIPRSLRQKPRSSKRFSTTSSLPISPSLKNFRSPALGSDGTCSKSSSFLRGMR
ncbi:hypothetical protein CC80DRAFT_164829 [Byssothecium circinans]|uniref:Uncharacterized protein n=1 Tax=Byssothecium circinans TaxID=147558 RepID=A0A6A5TM60_9PLEO|nr:hypothetical protein CC80DRAFT_164829 [Byssothecium circinans]